jgi:hypothetical protein
MQIDPESGVSSGRRELLSVPLFFETGQTARGKIGIVFLGFKKL